MSRLMLPVLPLVTVVCAWLPVDAAAQMPSAPAEKALVSSLASSFRSVATNVLKAAEQLPEADYAYRPVDTVRTFGQLIGHVADSQRGLCVMASGQKDTSTTDSETLTSKTALIDALKASMHSATPSTARSTTGRRCSRSSSAGTRCRRPRYWPSTRATRTSTTATS